ncbi:MAG TPA: GFA family protein [Kofleriaceae bacterium]|nr:GFA family protein [Kofleriaceae bacterium]
MSERASTSPTDPTRSAAMSGRCLCGAVQIELDPPTDYFGICHCRSCRLSHGAPCVAWTSVPLAQLRFLTGEDRVRWYRSSPLVRWGFCGECGSHLLYRADGEGHPESPRVGHVYVSAACLEPPLDRELEGHVSFEEKLPWFPVADSLPKQRGKGLEELDG